MHEAFEDLGRHTHTPIHVHEDAYQIHASIGRYVMLHECLTSRGGSRTGDVFPSTQSKKLKIHVIVTRYEKTDHLQFFDSHFGYGSTQNLQ